MKKTIELILSPEIAFDEIQLQQHIKSSNQIKDENQFDIRLLKRSIDARSRNIKVNIQAEIYVDEIPENIFQYEIKYKEVRNSKNALFLVQV